MAQGGVSVRLRRGIDLGGVVSLGLGTAVGVSLFSAIGPAAGLGGPGMLAAVAAAALPMSIIALSYGFLGSVLPTSGASFAWPSRFLHPAIGFGVAWLRIAGTTGAMLVLALAFARYLGMAVALPPKPVMAALFTAIAAANLAGVTLAARLQTALMALLLATLALFVALGAPAVAIANFSPLLPHGVRGALATLPLLIGLFFGIEAATELGDEVAGSRRNIPLGIAASLGAALAVYLLVAGVAVGVASANGLASSDAPLLAAGKRFLGAGATPLIVAAALIATAKSLNALFLVFSRSLFAMACAGLLPSSLARIDTRRGTPAGAILTVYVLCLAGLLLPTSFTFLFLAVNVPTLLKYAAICASADRVAAWYPDLHARAAFRLPRQWTRIVGWTGVAAAAAIAALGVATDASPYFALLGWGAVGVPFWLARDRARQAENTLDEAAPA